MTSPQPVQAGLFHVGNTCPHCQESIAAGQLIVSCPDCGGFHHETCWTHKSGCSSYHCDRAVKMTNLTSSPDIVLSFDEVAKATPQPPRRARPAHEVAAAFLPPKPTRHSRLAKVGAGAAALSIIGLFGALAGNIQLVVLGTVLAFAAIVTAVIALLRINNPDNRISGLGTAVTATVLPVVLVIVYFVTLNVHYSKTSFQSRVNMNLRESLPKESSLAQMAPWMAGAMRANVVVRSGGTFGGQSMGSGVVLRLDDKRATIITNKHVIGNTASGEIQILFYTGEESSARIEWTAPEGVDLVILSCQTLTLSKYAQIELAEQTVMAGSSVFAIGNPMGLAWTYTDGSISGHRVMDGGPDGVELYQTQTPINFGNSGGGLFTKDGKLIGINTMTKDKQVAEGLSFAISVSTLKKLLTAAESAKWLPALKKDLPAEKLPADPEKATEQPAEKPAEKEPGKGSGLPKSARE
jgi:S1-C subfamily serine protease